MRCLSNRTGRQLSSRLVSGDTRISPSIRMSHVRTVTLPATPGCTKIGKIPPGPEPYPDTSCGANPLSKLRFGRLRRSSTYNIKLKAPMQVFIPRQCVIGFFVYVHRVIKQANIGKKDYANNHCRREVHRH